MQNARKKLISKKIKIDQNKIEFFDHHQCHAYYGYYGSDFQNKKVAIITSDGGGDNTNGSIWISSGNKLIEKYRTNICNIGRIYRYITLILGMKPTEHEFKVMGMAGYGIEKLNFYDKAIKIFKDTLNVEELNLNTKLNLKIIFFIIKKNLMV